LTIAGPLDEAEMREECSIIITTRDSARTLGSVLRSARSQTVPTEVVVVDNFSTDETVELASSMGATVVTAGDERSRQRNEGARVATGDWLLFVDADMELSPDLVESCLEGCRESGAQAAIIPQSARGEGFFARARAFEKSCYQHDDELEAPRFFSKALFTRVGGYDPELVAAEDWDIAARVRSSGVDVVRVTGTLEHLDGRIRLADVYRKMEYYSGSLIAYRAKHPELSKRQMNPIRAALLRQWPQVLRKPHLGIGLVLLKCAETAGFLTGAVKQKLRERRNDPANGIVE
jgi:glycosyltransferase involved in cell wall biosynthesis